MDISSILAETMGGNFATQFALLSGIIGIIVQAIKMTGKVDSKYLQLISIVVGMLLGSGLAFQQGTDMMMGLLTGVFSGATVTGLYGAVKNPLK